MSIVEDLTSHREDGNPMFGSASSDASNNLPIERFVVDEPFPRHDKVSRGDRIVQTQTFGCLLTRWELVW